LYNLYLRTTIHKFDDKKDLSALK